MTEYPRLSCRVSKPIRLRLEAIAIEKGTTLSKMVQGCLQCLLDNPDCKGWERIKSRKVQ